MTLNLPDYPELPPPYPGSALSLCHHGPPSRAYRDCELCMAKLDDFQDRREAWEWLAFWFWALGWVFHGPREKVEGAQPLHEPVFGAPFQPGDEVVVVKAIDRNVYDVRRLVGLRGRVKYLEYSCGCGQSYPGDPMIGVDFGGGVVEELWREELAATPAGGLV